MIDALMPASAAWDKALEAGRPVDQAWSESVAAAEAGADSTAALTPKLGRASYLGQRAVGTPDGGAVAVAIWMKALSPFVR
jgi:dihydroxyacetone kinase